MKVKLISTTPMALELLILTKESRLGGEKDLREIQALSQITKMEALNYMTKTIKSAFEFVDYVFHITGVSRAFTHQLVRTRTASFQQESMRAVDARANGYYNPTGNAQFNIAALNVFDSYERLVDAGMPIQDARGILPIATKTGIMMKINLRALSQMAEHRLCTRTQGEYQDVFRLMKEQVLFAHPWAEPLLNAYCVQHGVCCFPNYTKCPVQKNTFRVTRKHCERIQAALEATDHEANPVAKNGRTM